MAAPQNSSQHNSPSESSSKLQAFKMLTNMASTYKPSQHTCLRIILNTKAPQILPNTTDPQNPSQHGTAQNLIQLNTSESSLTLSSSESF